MKKYFLVILICTLNAITISAQQTDKIEYKNLVVEKDGFSLEAPKDLRELSPGTSTERFFGYGNYEVYLLIKSDTYGNNSLKKMLVKLAEENNAKVSEFDLKKLKANYYTFFDKEGFYQKILIAKFKGRNLIFHTVSLSYQNPVVKNFYSSLKFDKVDFLLPIEENTETENEVVSDEQTKTAINEKKDSDVKIAFDFENNEESKSEADKNSSVLKILSKPRPSYTDLARYYNMQGTVTLRVTFLANGEIASVSPVKKLPFGLTLNAIKAAKLFQFEPAKRNGIPYSVVKAVQFSFTIY